ncbi:alginate export family protein, partial [Lactiplantibacillus plantarum]|nr:alginate export family protein [Lactiplantibacillus plantarum]
VQVKPSDRLDGFVSARGLWLQQARDSFARTGVRDSAGGSGRFAGYQLETKVRYWLVPRSLRLEISGAVLFDEGFLRDAPNATGLGDTVYGAIDITKTF